MMRLDTDGERVTIETGPEDRELVAAAGETVQSVVGLGKALGFLGGNEDGERETCRECGETRICRPMGVKSPGGDPRMEPHCRDCQTEMVEAKVAGVAAERAAEQGDGDRGGGPDAVTVEPGSECPTDGCSESVFEEPDAGELWCPEHGRVRRDWVGDDA